MSWETWSDIKPFKSIFCIYLYQLKRALHPQTSQVTFSYSRLSSEDTPSSWRALCSKRPQQDCWESLPIMSQSSGLPYHGHPFSIILKLKRVLCVRRPQQWLWRAPNVITEQPGMSRPSQSLTLPMWRFVSQKTGTMTSHSLFTQCHYWAVCH